MDNHAHHYIYKVKFRGLVHTSKNYTLKKSKFSLQLWSHAIANALLVNSYNNVKPFQTVWIIQVKFLNLWKQYQFSSGETIGMIMSSKVMKNDLLRLMFDSFHISCLLITFWVDCICCRRNYESIRNQKLFLESIAEIHLLNL